MIVQKLLLNSIDIDLALNKFMKGKEKQKILSLILVRDVKENVSTKRNECNTSFSYLS